MANPKDDDDGGSRGLVLPELLLLPAAPAPPPPRDRATARPTRPSFLSGPGRAAELDPASAAVGGGGGIADETAATVGGARCGVEMESGDDGEENECRPQ
jgi:hypothetical protein